MSGTGPQKRRRRLVGGTTEGDAPGGEEEDQEAQEKLPLESEALLRQLIHQQRGSLLQYRREVAALERQREEQKRELLVASQRQEAVLSVWGELQSDLLLLKARVAARIDADLLAKLLAHPESSLFAPSLFRSEDADVKSEEDSASPDGGLAASSSARLSFEAPLWSDSEEDSDDEASGAPSSAAEARVNSPTAEEAKKTSLAEELRSQREWTLSLLRDVVAAVEAQRQGRETCKEEPKEGEGQHKHSAAASGSLDADAETGSASLPENVVFDRVRRALHKLREDARRYRRRARTAELALRARKKEALALKVETDRLQKQQALLKYRFKVLSGASPESAASLLQAAGLKDEALEENVPSARLTSETGAFADSTAAGGRPGVSGAPPAQASGVSAGASGAAEASSNGAETDAVAGGQGGSGGDGVKSAERGESAAGAWGEGLATAAGSGEGLAFLPHAGTPEELLEHFEALQMKLREREKDISALQDERAKAEKLAAEVKMLRTLSHELVIQSPPYVELQQQASKLEETVVARSAEVEELRRELLQEQKQKDEEFDKLLAETKEQTDGLLEKMKTLTDDLQNACIEREKALGEAERLRQELLQSRASQEEQETVFAQRCVQLSKLKMQHEQLKNAGSQMLLRNERMRKERQGLIEAVRQKDEIIYRLQLRLRAEERQKQDTGSSPCSPSGNASSSPTGGSDSCAVASSPPPKEEDKGKSPPNEPILQDPPSSSSPSASSSAAASSPLPTGASMSPGESRRNSLSSTPSLSLSDGLDLAGLPEGQGLEVQLGKIKLEKEALQRRLADYDQLVAEIAGLREQYARVSEEVEEVSKAFEERQTFCEHLLKQIREKDEALADHRNRSASFLQQQQMLSRLSRLHDQKLLLLRQQYEQTTANSRVYAEALQQANVRVALADQQREEATLLYQSTRAARDALFKEKEEVLAKLSTVVEANKVLDAAAQESSSKRTAAENEARRLTDAKAELEKRIEKLKAKEEKQDRKRAHTAALEELSVRDLQLLKDENETMRRRLICFVCNERFKDHIINKCGHMFCQVCLERNVKTRNRKCPHCKTPFDQKDIRKVYLDN